MQIWSFDKNNSLNYQRLLTDGNSEEYLPCDLSPSLGSKPYHPNLIESIDWSYFLPEHFLIFTEFWLERTTILLFSITNVAIPNK